MSKFGEISYYERQKIAVRYRCGWGPRRIGRYLKRDHSVISREIKRNSKKNGVYDAEYAQDWANQRKKKTNQRMLVKDKALAQWVIWRLRDNQWSPEQIAGILKNSPPEHLSGRSVSHEAIYSWIYADQQWLYKYLRRKKIMYRQKRKSRTSRIQIPFRTPIHVRPAAVNLRRQIGDWESDTMVFSKQKTALSVQYERKSMLVRIHKVENRGADETLEAIKLSIDSLPPDSFQSITFDNGLEASRHFELNIPTYFCDPYSSWQKGGVENMNGLIRQYLPRSTDLSTLTRKQIYDIQERLNNRPRKSLNYKTPNQAFWGSTSLQSGALNP